MERTIWEANCIDRLANSRAGSTPSPGYLISKFAETKNLEYPTENTGNRRHFADVESVYPLYLVSQSSGGEPDILERFILVVE
jgi:hypothetical protein